MNDRKIPERLQYLNDWMQSGLFYRMALFVACPGFCTFAILLLPYKSIIPDTPWIPYLVFVHKSIHYLKAAWKWNRIAIRRCGNLTEAQLISAILQTLDGHSRRDLRLLHRIDVLDGRDVSLFRFYCNLAARTTGKDLVATQYKYEIDDYIPAGGYKMVLSDTFITSSLHLLGCPIEEKWSLVEDR